MIDAPFESRDQARSNGTTTRRIRRQTKKISMFEYLYPLYEEGYLESWVNLLLLEYCARTPRLSAVRSRTAPGIDS